MGDRMGNKWHRCAELMPPSSRRRKFRRAGVYVSGPHGDESLFLWFITIAQYAVGGTNADGPAALRRSGDFSERFRVVPQGVRTFSVQDAQVKLRGCSG